MMSYNSNGDKFSTDKDYFHEMVNRTVYSGYFELVVTGNIFSFFIFYFKFII